MTRKKSAIAPLAIVLLLARFASAQAPRPPAFDLSRIFILGDADLDGRLSLEEYRDFLSSAPHMKGAVATIEPMFRRLDADGDGFLSLPEYRKSFPRRPGGAVVEPEPPRVDQAVAAADMAPVTAEQETFFEAKIGSVLARECARCHASTPEKLTAGLRVDSRDGLRLGGHSGPAVVPGNLDESLIIRAIRYLDEDLQMPPKSRLAEKVIADFEQ